MSSFNEMCDLEIRFNQNIDGLHLQLLDGNFNTVYEGVTNQLSVSVAKGVYLLKINFLDYYQEEFIFVDDNKKVELDIKYPATAPVLGFITTHEYFSYPAADTSRQCTVDSSETMPPNFCFFAARYDMHIGTTAAEEWLQHYSVYNEDGTVFYQLDILNSCYDNHFGSVGFSARLNPGVYFLHYKNGDESNIFPMYVFDGYQSQFFVRYRDAPDFLNSIVFYTQRMMFDIAFEEYLVLDKIQFAYKDISNYALFTERDKAIIAQHPYLVALMNTLKYSLRGNEVAMQIDFDHCPALPIPDLLIAQTGREMLFDLSEELPLLSFTMNMYTHVSNREALLFKPGSLVDRVIDYAQYNLFWNNFSNIGKLEEWKPVYSEVLKNASFFSEEKSDSPEMRMCKQLVNSLPNKHQAPEAASAVDVGLNYLMGEKVVDKESADKINEIIGQVSDVISMSKELGVPLTSVLRDFKSYRELYNDLKSRL